MTTMTLEIVTHEIVTHGIIPPVGAMSDFSRDCMCVTHLSPAVPGDAEATRTHMESHHLAHRDVHLILSFLVLVLIALGD